MPISTDDQARLERLAQGAVLAATTDETLVLSFPGAMWLASLGDEGEQAWKETVDRAAQEAGYKNGDDLRLRVGIDLGDGNIMLADEQGNTVVLRDPGLVQPEEQPFNPEDLVIEGPGTEEPGEQAA